MSSRVGFEQLEENYPAGQLAPITVVLESEQEIDVQSDFLAEVNEFKGLLEDQKGITSVSPELTDEMIENADIPDEFLSSSGKRSEEHTSELQSRGHLVCRLLLEKKK